VLSKRNGRNIWFEPRQVCFALQVKSMTVCPVVFDVFSIFLSNSSDGVCMYLVSLSGESEAVAESSRLSGRLSSRVASIRR